MVVFKYCGNKQRKRDFIIVDKQPITQKLFEECVEYMFPKAFVTEVRGYIKNKQLILTYTYVTENENIKPKFIYSKGGK